MDRREVKPFDFLRDRQAEERMALSLAYYRHMQGACGGSCTYCVSTRGAILDLANGKSVPDECIAALDNLEQTWPGSTLRQARGAIVLAVLEANKKVEKKR